MIKIKSTDKLYVAAELRKYSIEEIFDSLAEYIIKDNEKTTPRIIISEEQFNEFFRIRGTQIISDNDSFDEDMPKGHTIRRENRGRPKGSKNKPK